MARSVPLPPAVARVGGLKGDFQLSRSYAPRCPSCNEGEVFLDSALVDEEGTLALRPQELADNEAQSDRDYRYQEYRFLHCSLCEYIWFTEPTARWSTKPDRLTSEPHGNKPRLVIDENTRRPVREPQDFRRFERLDTGRFSDARLADQVTHANVLLLTGAGASVPFGLSTATEFQLPEIAQSYLQDLLLGDLPRSRTFGEYLKSSSRKRRFLMVEHAHRDVEVLMDVLLQLQQLCVLEGGDAELEEALAESEILCPSWFAFSEALGSGSLHPPINRASLSGALAPVLQSSSHLRRLRHLLQHVSIRILTMYGIPEASAVAKARRVLKPLLDELKDFVSGPLPAFTTNYDEIIEATILSSGERGRLRDGFQAKAGRTLLLGEAGKVPVFWYDPEVWHECGNSDVALFHLHGTACSLVDPESGKLYYADCEREQLPELLNFAWAFDDPHPVGAILPATCKDRYLYSQPFATAYDYLSATLDHARAAIIIGQSGRDEMIKRILAQGARQNPEIVFLVVGYGHPPPHLFDVLPEDRREFWGEGFSKEAAEWVLARLRSRLPSGKTRSRKPPQEE